MRNILKAIIDGYLKPYRNIPMPIGVGLLAAFANALSSGMTFLFSIYFVKNLELSMIVVGYIISVFGVGTIVGAYVGGRLCDKFSALYICIASLFSNSISLMIFPSLHALHGLLVVVFAMGFSNYAFTPAIRVWVMSRAGGELRLRVVGMLRMISNLGLGLSIYIGSSVAVFSFNLAFYVFSIILFVCAIFLIFINFSYKFIDIKSSDLKKSSNLVCSDNQDKGIYLIYISIFMVGLIFSQIRITYPLYLHESYGFNTHGFGQIMLINTLLIALLQTHILDFFSKINPIGVACIGSLLIGIGMSLLPTSQLAVIAILLCLMWTLGEMFFFSTTQMLTFDKARSTSKGKHMGMYQMIYASTNILGPFLGGMLYHAVSGEAVWIACGILGAASFLILGSYFYTSAYKRS